MHLDTSRHANMSEAHSRALHRTEEEAYFEEDGDGTGSMDRKARQSHRRAMATRFLGRLKEEGTAVPTVKNESEVDPLDAFMADINASLVKDERKIASEGDLHISKKAEERFEDETDTAAEFIELREKLKAREGPESEDESDDDFNRKGPIALPVVNHSEISYRPIEKNMYKEPESIANLSVDEINVFKKEKKISVTGYQVPNPIESFHQLSGIIERGLLNNIKKKEWDTPTPIQCQSIPVVLSGRDCLGLASTGSGKTGAYLIPVIQHVCKILDRWKVATMPNHGGPVALIVCPTRELAFQIYNLTQFLSVNLKLRISCFVGGYEKTQQFKEINRGIEICIGNPGRLVDLGTMKGGLSFKDSTCLVVDEADRMLDFGFATEVLSISRSMRPDKLTLMFSATMSDDVEKLGKEITNRPVKITIGIEGQASSLIEQRPVVFVNEQRKGDWLVKSLHKLIRWERQLLIFCNSHGRVLDLAAVINDVLSSPPPPTTTTTPDNNDDDEDYIDQQPRTPQQETHSMPPPPEQLLPAVLAPAFVRLSANLSDNVSSREDLQSLSGHHTAGDSRFEPSVIVPKTYAKVMFGDMNQGERAEVLSGFRKKKFPILVATDVAARGLDIPQISTVISYDAAMSSDIHIHRIGRTGRAGAQGLAYTLLTRNNQREAGFVVESMENVGQTPSKYVLQLAMSYEPFKTAKMSGRSFSRHLEVKYKRKKDKGGTTAAALSSVGLGFGHTQPTSNHASPNKGSFVRSSTIAAIQSSVQSTKRRWDNTQHHSTEQKPPIDDESTEGQQHRKRSCLLTTNLGQLNSTLHVDLIQSRKDVSQTNKARIFNPDDEISSDEDNSPPVASENPKQSSLLNLNKRQERATKNQLALAQERALQAVIASSKRQANWEPNTPAATTPTSDHNLLWGQLLPQQQSIKLDNSAVDNNNSLVHTSIPSSQRKSRWE